MNEFLIDNLLGKEIILRLSNKVLKGVLEKVSDDCVWIKDTDGKTIKLKGSLTQDFIEEHDINSRLDSENRHERLSSNDNSSFEKEQALNEVPRKIELKETDISPFQRNLFAKKLKPADGVLPADGEIINFLRDKGLCYIYDYKHTDSKDVCLLVNYDLIQNSDYSIKRLTRGAQIRYYRLPSSKSNQNPKAKIAFFDMKVNEVFDDINEGQFPDEELPYFKKYLKEKMLDMETSGKKEDVISIIKWCKKAKTIDDDYKKELTLKQIDILKKTEDTKELEHALLELKDTISLQDKDERCSILIEIARLQIKNERKREVIKRTLEDALNNNPLSNDARELMLVVRKMPRTEQGNYNDLVVEIDEEKHEQPSALIMQDPSAIEQLGEKLINYEYNRQEISNYALNRGKSIYNNYKSHIGAYGVSALEPLRDSAVSFIIEAIKISKLSDTLLLDAMTRYIKLVTTAYQVASEKKPVFDGTFSQILINALGEKDPSLKSIVIQTIISIGACSSEAWNQLVNNDDGLKFCYDMLFSPKKRKETFRLINSLNYTVISEDLTVSDFLYEIFRLKRQQKNQLRELQTGAILDLEDPDNSTYAWFDQMELYKYLLPSTDERYLESLSQIIDKLSPLRNASEDEELEILSHSKSDVDKILDNLHLNPTFFGRTLFMPICQRWKKTIEDGRQKKMAKQYPVINIEADPPHVLISGGIAQINLNVRNIGTGKTITPDGFSMKISISDEEEKQKYNTMYDEDVRLRPDPDGTDTPHTVSIRIPEKLNNISPLKLRVETKAKKNGAVLPKTDPYECTITSEPRQEELIGEEERPKWVFSGEVSRELFKGRDELIDKLIKHYTVNILDARSYVLYGLTRMGKSSILNTLAKRIMGAKISINGKEYVIMPIRCSFNALTGFDKLSKVWNLFLNEIVYNKLMDYSRRINPETNKPWDFNIQPVTKLKMNGRHVNPLFEMIHKAGIHPLILFDEYTFVEKIFDEKGMQAGPSFLHDLRELAFNHKASFIYAGTYDTKELISDPRYGATQGSMAGQIEEHISNIDPTSAEELMDLMTDKLRFTKEAKAYIHRLSGDVPYFIQMICYYSACFARDAKRTIIGYPELEYVIGIMTGRIVQTEKSKIVDISKLYANDFLGNMIDSSKPEEQDVISCLVKLGSDRQNKPQKVRFGDFHRLWVHNYSEDDQKAINALRSLREKRIITETRDDNELIYKINVDLFRQWWAVEYSMQVERLKNN
ncbi:MAG: hypothetical protein IK075_04405 [Prevotella sp.]|nr:hypothetical protein [Prevotella sp.]